MEAHRRRLARRPARLQVALAFPRGNGSVRRSPLPTRHPRPVDDSDDPRSVSARVIVFAHVGAPLEPHDLWGAWTFEPVTVAALALSATLYAVGLRRLWRAAGIDRGIRRAEAWSFAVGWLLLVLSLVSPLHALGGVLFSAHMTQHELLMTVAAPLFVIGKPLVPFIWALSPAWRRRTGRWSESAPVAAVWRGLTHPLVAFVVHGAAVWVWHAPSLYDA